MTSLTWRQTACILERQWARKLWEIETGIVTNPMASFEDEKKKEPSSGGDGTIDATTEDGIAQLQRMGLPVKRLE